MAEAKVTQRTRLQGRRIAALRERLGVSKVVMAGRLGFESSRSYEHYEEGRSILRFDRVPEWAQAFEMTELDFLTAVLGSPDGDQPLTDENWNFRAALKGHIPDEMIEQLAPDWINEPVANQKAAVAGILRMAALARTDATTPTKMGGRSA